MIPVDCLNAPAGTCMRAHERMELQQPNTGLGAYLGALEPPIEGGHEHRVHGEPHLVTALSETVSWPRRIHGV